MNFTIKHHCSILFHNNTIISLIAKVFFNLNSIYRSKKTNCLEMSRYVVYNYTTRYSDPVRYLHQIEDYRKNIHKVHIESNSYGILNIKLKIITRQWRVILVHNGKKL